MARPTDSTVRSAARDRASALQAVDLCSWCLGAGHYLEPLDCDVGHAYVPVICEACGGRGRTPA